MRYLTIILFLILGFSGCEENRMENYRIDYSGDFSFRTIIRDENGINDTVDFSGTIEPVYGNLKDVIYIQFVPAFIIDPLLRENGQLANNAWWLQQSSPINIAGSFRNNKQEIVFSYLIGTEQTYIRYQVSGQRTN
jgi:hypothetical protein